MKLHAVATDGTITGGGTGSLVYGLAWAAIEWLWPVTFEACTGSAFDAGGMRPSVVVFGEIGMPAVSMVYIAGLGDVTVTGSVDCCADLGCALESSECTCDEFVGWAAVDTVAILGDVLA